MTNMVDLILCKYKVMYRHWFPSQDGMDYVDGEVSGELHDSLKGAKEELAGYQDDPHFAGENFWIKTVEVEA